MSKICLPRGTKKVTVEMLDKMKKMRVKGYSYGYIAQLFGLSRSTVFNYLSGASVPYSDDELSEIANKK